MSLPTSAEESMRLTTLLIAILSQLTTSQSSADENYGKACKIGNHFIMLAADGDANSCRALALASNAQEFQIGCRKTNNTGLAMLSKPISITDKSARLRSSSLMENTENANGRPEEFAACAKLWDSR